MKINRFFCLAAAALLGVVSCNKVNSGEEVPYEAGTPIRLSVGVSGQVSTKATGVTPQAGSTYQSANEAKVNSLQVFVFNGDSRDGYNIVANNLICNVECTAGVRDIYTVVNGPDLSGVTSKSALMSSVASMQSGVLDSFAMFGSALNKTLAQSANIEISVKRLAARVVIRGIQNDLTSDALANAFHIDAVYLTNVAGDWTFGGDATYEVTKWYNKQGYEASNNLGAVIYDSVDQDRAKGATYSTAHFFYSFPNAFAPNSGGSWSPRRAKLVVAVTIAGKKYFYPIRFPELQSNKTYELNLLKLTRVGNDPDDYPPGSTEPEEDEIDGVTQGIEIDVLDWDLVLVGDAGTITI